MLRKSDSVCPAVEGDIYANPPSPSLWDIGGGGVKNVRTGDQEGKCEVLSPGHGRNSEQDGYLPKTWTRSGQLKIPAQKEGGSRGPASAEEPLAVDGC